ncbi:ABC transporter ATP-binding protein [Mariniblastus sp.]|nr:ABC transporter ATP-binding protein [Mariniblastus sp.]MDB4380480.1 ABC transporter ATP-binding protein [Mariniblastus sp.]
MIQIENLKFQYPRTEFMLRLPRLVVESGQRVAVVGPSGCGKTTLLNLISGITLPLEGAVMVCGEEVSAMSDASRRNFRIAKIGMVFQQFELVEYLDVLSNILLPFSINSTLSESSETRCRAIEFAEAMGLKEKLARRPAQLSQGEQQRVAICRALITEPGVVLADEPTGNLDPKNKRRILDLIFQLAEKNNQTLIVVTHDMGILDGFDRVIDFEKMRFSNVDEESSGAVRGAVGEQA